MEFELDQYKNLKSQQVEIAKGLTILVGTNGSGKSSFLEYLFLNNEFDSSIVYSSGINESFSPKYREYLNSLYWQSRRSIFSEKQGDVQSIRSKFFFTKEWAPFLILVASFLSTSDSNIQKWMNHFNLKVALFNFQLYLPSTFRNKLKAAYEELEAGRVDYGFESSRVVKFLSRLVDNEQEKLTSDIRVNTSWGSKENLTPNPRSSMNAVIFTQLFELSLFTSSENQSEAIGNFFQMLQALSTGGSRSRFIPLENTEMIFSKGDNLVSLQNLSDGEFQILLNSALIDLFDNDDSLFLLDEVDAHIHPTMINKVWSSFDNVEGFVFTTSHNLLTISNSEYNRIVFLEDGTIVSDTAKKVKLVDDICGTLFGAPIWKSLLYTVENLVLIDGLGDWAIFKELMLKTNYNFGDIENRFLVIERSSGTDHDSRENLLKAKKIFVDDMLQVAKKSKIPQSQIKLKNIFLICDSDEYVFSGEGLDIRSGIQRKGSIRFNVHSIVWNRRNIESYLISPNARLHYDESSSEGFSWGELSGFGSLNENNLNNESIKRVDSKVIVRRFIGDEGFDDSRMKEYVSRMSNEEVDLYLTLVAEKMIEIINA